MYDFIATGFFEGILRLLASLHWSVYLVIVAVLIVRFTVGNLNHLSNIFAARRRLTTFRSIEHPAAQFKYIRSVDPYVFEEMILTALKDAGHRIRRNRRYSGDGGIDGKVYIEGALTLIQAKRYKNHISAQHVADFEQTCQRRRCKGLFVHTGRTGKKAWSLKGNVVIISGERLLRLLAGNGF